MTSLYKTPVTNLNGIGEKRAALFARLGIKSVGDLISPTLLVSFILFYK